MHHQIKIDVIHFNQIEAGTKTCELRFNDRDYEAGDTITLQETVHSAQAMRQGKPLEYTGREIKITVTHVLLNVEGLQPHWVILSFRKNHGNNTNSD